jgi:CRP/FNR family transcriptional regulator
MITVPCRACPLRRHALFVPFTDEELAFMERFKKGELIAAAGTTILLEGSSAPQLYTVLRGEGVRSKTLPDGRRQVINFVFPGDLIGLQAGLLGEMKHSIEARTAMMLCVFDRAALWRLFRASPARAYDLTWIAAVEEHFLGETVASLGQRDATERVAWALLRIWLRLRAIGLAENGAVPFPFRQQDLADALGLSLVHTNKTLARLRERQLVQWTDRSLRVLDPERLAVIGHTDLERPERRPLM